MKKRTKIIAGVVAVAAVGGLLAWRSKASTKPAGFTTVDIARGTIVDKALAVGQIVPDKEIQVKSQISGIVNRTFVEVGDRVEVGQSLFSISPDPTPLELADTERQLELAQVSFDKAEKDLDRAKTLFSGGILSSETYDSRQQAFDSARIEVAQAQDRLALLREGRIERRVGGVDSVIRASSAGTVLERKVNEGDPVVPLTTFQDGTVMMTLADMGALEFRGTVDEIDVGKMSEGMPVRIQIGALPGRSVPAKLTKIAPKAREKEGATVFDVEAAIEPEAGVVLRAGYSANADVIIQEKKDVLLVPERLVIMEGEKAFVELPAADPKAEPTRKEIEVGLSDGLNMEVLAGLAEGDKVIQRPPKEIE